MDITQQDYYAAQGRVQADNATDEDRALVEAYESVMRGEGPQPVDEAVDRQAEENIE